MTSTHTDPKPDQARTPATAQGHVVVGYDGSWHSRAALHRAAREAGDRGLPLTVLSVVATYDETEPEPVAGATRAGSPQQEWERASSDAAAAAEELRAAAPGVPVAVEVLLDNDVDRLRGELARCRLLVLGNRGRQEVRAFLLGSTSRLLVRSASCPVLVVPDVQRSAVVPQPARRLPDGSLVGAVLVGLGDGDEAPRALNVAAEEARRRRRPLHVLRSYAGMTREGSGHRARLAWDAVQRRLNAADLPADLHVTVILTPDPPADALVQHGRLAELVVVGSRGPIALARLASDSVSRALLDAATWPVLVVPA